MKESHRKTFVEMGRRTKWIEKPWTKILLTESYLLYMSTKRTGN